MSSEDRSRVVKLVGLALLVGGVALSIFLDSALHNTTLSVICLALAFAAFGIFGLWGNRLGKDPTEDHKDFDPFHPTRRF